MKKLLVLSLVLGIASLATAGLSLGSNYDGETTLAASDTVLLNVSLDATAIFFESHNYVVVADTSAATISGGTAAVIAAVVNKADGPTAQNADVMLPEGEEGMFYIFANTGAPAGVPQGTVLISDILFHCEGNGDVLVKLYEVTSGVPTTEANLVGSLLIHQVPEPATMALLGLGALVLRRKK